MFSWFMFYLLCVMFIYCVWYFVLVEVEIGVWNWDLYDIGG